MLEEMAKSVEREGETDKELCKFTVSHFYEVPRHHRLLILKAKHVHNALNLRVQPNTQSPKVWRLLVPL